MRRKVTIADVVDMLNDALERDQFAVSSLISIKVTCSKSLADHESIQAWDCDGNYHVGMLGFLNGLFGTDEDGWGGIAVTIGEDGLVEEFIVRESWAA